MVEVVDIECPQGLSYEVRAFRNTCYQFVDIETKWTAAQQYCDGNKGMLVKITNQETMDFLSKTLAGASNPAFWIGANDKTNEGVWKWTDATDVTYSNWSPGEPNLPWPKDHNNDCALIKRDMGWKWSSIECYARSSMFNFICQYVCGTCTWKPTTPTIPTTPMTTTTSTIVTTTTTTPRTTVLTQVITLMNTTEPEIQEVNNTVPSDWCLILSRSFGVEKCNYGLIFGVLAVIVSIIAIIFAIATCVCLYIKRNRIMSISSNKSTVESGRERKLSNTLASEKYHYETPVMKLNSPRRSTLATVKTMYTRRSTQGMPMVAANVEAW